MNRKRALISVTDKTDLVAFAGELHKLGFELVSTSGTAKAIKDANLPCTLVENVTHFPEMLNGRVRTLHPNIFAGIIADQNDPEHMTTLGKYAIKTFDLIAVNLYAFGKDPCIENIDVGGPSMIRAAAKNYDSVTVVVDPADYANVLQQLRANGSVDEEQRQILAAKAFRATEDYDRMIANEFYRCIADKIHVPIGKKHC